MTAPKTGLGLSGSLLAAAALLAGGHAHAHITLPPGGAAAGSDYEAAFRVGHACKGATATTGVDVRLPKGFTLSEAVPRKSWKLDVQKSGDGEVRWTADGPASALPAAERAEFIVRGKLTATPGPLWFKVLQTCDTGSADWAQVPAAAGDKPDFPAARLDVLPPGVAAVDVKDAWVRQTVPGQSGTGLFMKLTAPSGARLVGASTPAAGIAEVHEMKMEGDTMKMRELPKGLELPPRQTVELKSGGYHMMLMDLKQPMRKGESIPMTLKFQDAKGATSELQLTVPVGAPAAAKDDGHMHMSMPMPPR
ncbi:MAG: copper chaperone PCu(A)C [Gammaproteobacteria bacterium]|nr:copper chaperone PCu(A)C [Gammaproteobacteria bacterium]MBU1442689.1 copper chaperone PCu(A)C [Gammaproteobacteria bacterium]MBU2407229.1 copper chaperone PCu(A)C [Gammaproteobacteria bacterium]